MNHGECHARIRPMAFPVLQILANYQHFSLEAVFPGQTLIDSNLGYSKVND